MSTINSSDIFLVNRNGTSYKVTAEQLVEKLQAGDYTIINRGGTTYKAAGIDGISNANGTDLMVVNRGGTAYKVSCSDVQTQWLLKWAVSVPNDVGQNSVQMAGVASNGSNITVATTYKPSVIVSSNLGVNWSAQSGLQSYVAAPHYVPGVGKFFGGPFGRDKIMTSTNGIQWTEDTANIPGGNGAIDPGGIYTSDIKHFAFATPRIMICTNSGTMAYATNGSSWTTASFFNSQYDVPFKFMALSSDGKGIVTLTTKRDDTVIWYTVNGGVSWRPTGFTQNGWNYYFPAYRADTQRFYALTRTTVSSNAAMWISNLSAPNTGTEYVTNLPAGKNIQNFTYNASDGHFYAMVSLVYDEVFRSPDGITWTSERLPSRMAPAVMESTGGSVIMMNTFKHHNQVDYPNQFLYRLDQ